MKTAAAATIFLLSILFFSAAADAYTELTTLDPQCEKDGSLAFTVRDQKGEAVFTDDILITAKHPGLSEATIITGGWDKDAAEYSRTDPTQGTATFHSYPGLLANPGDYHIIVNYRGCRDEPNCKTAFNLDACPGQRVLCDKDGLAVKSCTVRGDTLYLDVGVTPAVKRFLDLSEDMLLYIDSDKRSLMGVHLFAGTDISSTGNDTYRLKVPLAPHETIGSAGVAQELCMRGGIPSRMIPCEDPASAAEETAVVDIPPKEGDEEIREENETADGGSGTVSEKQEDTFIGITGAAVGGEEEGHSFFTPLNFFILLGIVVVGVIYLTFGDAIKEKLLSGKNDGVQQMLRKKFK